MLRPVLEYLAAQLAQRLGELQSGVCPVEALGQYFLDLAWVDAVLSR